MPTDSLAIETSVPPSSGYTLGGIGAGGIELWPDGVFRHPGFLNTKPWAAYNSHGTVPAEPAFGVEDLFFILWVKPAGATAPQMRFLFVGQGNAFRSWDHMSRTYKYAFMPTVQRIRYDAAGPFVTLTYLDERLPVEVELTAWSPLIPHDHEVSLTPGLFLDFKVRNRSTTPVEVSITVQATNLTGFDRPHPRQAHEQVAHADGTLLQMRGDLDAPEHFSSGSQALFVRYAPGMHITTVASNPWLENLIHPLFATGSLDGPLLPPHLAREEILPKPGRDGMHRNRAWANARTTLAPGASTEPRFGYAWHFPNHIDAEGQRPGKAYAKLHADAASVAAAMLTHADTWKTRARLLPELVRGSSLPPAFGAALLDQLSTLARTTWVTANGTFLIWEGYGEACLNTVDVDHYGSFAVALLWPQFRKSALDLVAAGQRANGHVPHGYGAHCDPARIPAAEYGRWDCQCHYALAVYREWRQTGDAPFFSRHYPSAKRALELLWTLVPAGRELPVIAGGITYDHWHMEGTVTYLASLYLTSLAALAVMATAAGDQSLAADCATRRQRAVAEAEQLLWNGEFYRAVARTPEVAAEATSDQTTADGADRYALYAVGRGRDKPIDHGLHTDALNGEATAALLGLPRALNRDRVRQMLALVVARNTHADARFLANGTCPDGAFPDEFPFCQWQNPWTGTEYFFAAQLFTEGREAEGLRIIQNVHDRLTSEGMRFNHIECGDHYSRALSIYAAYQAWLGLRWDTIEGELTVLPVTSTRPLMVPLITSSALGRIEFQPTPAIAFRLTIFAGNLSIKSLVLPAYLANSECRLGNEFTQVTWSSNKIGAHVRLKTEIKLSLGCLLLCVTQH